MAWYVWKYNSLVVYRILWIQYGKRFFTEHDCHLCFDIIPLAYFSVWWLIIWLFFVRLSINLSDTGRRGIKMRVSNFPEEQKYYPIYFLNFWLFKSDFFPPQKLSNRNKLFFSLLDLTYTRNLKLLCLFRYSLSYYCMPFIDKFFVYTFYLKYL